MLASARSKVRLPRESSRTRLSPTLNVGFDPKGSHTALADCPYFFEHKEARGFESLGFWHLYIAPETSNESKDFSGAGRILVVLRIDPSRRGCGKSGRASSAAHHAVDILW